MGNRGKWKGIYERFYAKKIIKGLTPLASVRAAARLARQGRALDVGSGYGIHTLWLLGRGFVVDSIDFSPKSFSFIKKRTPVAHQPRLHTIQKDIIGFRLDGAYDLIVCTYVTQYFNSRERKRLFDKLRSHTAPGGVNVVEQAYRPGGGYMRWKAASVHFMREGELRQHYAGWNVRIHKIEAHVPRKGGVEVQQKEVMIAQRSSDAPQASKGGRKKTSN